MSVDLVWCRAVLLEQHRKVVRLWLRADWAAELRRVSEVAQSAAERGQLRVVYDSARSLKRRKPVPLRSVTFPDGTAATSEREVASAWLRVFAEQLGGQVLESTCIVHDCDVDPAGRGLSRVASVWKPSREDIAEAILSVGSNRGVGCDMVPVELLKCFPPASARILEQLFAKISAQTLLPHAWRGCLEVTVPKYKRVS